ncbi:MAG: hypothetical protein ACQEVT_16570 [Pseudomonadota bacterium]
MTRQTIDNIRQEKAFEAHVVACLTTEQVYTERLRACTTLVLSKPRGSIDCHTEYGSALITAAATGQIDVQTYAKSGTPDCHLDAIQEEMGA